MFEREINRHTGCPNRYHCRKDETKCCYLKSNNDCLLNTKDCEEYL